MVNYQNPSARLPVVLMVDDDPDDVFLTQRAFKGIEWKGKFQSVSSADELFELLGMNDSSSVVTPVIDCPDIVILDLNMPLKNGFEVLQAVRTHEQYAQLPIVVLSTSAHDDDIKRAYQLGANSFITKPVTPGDMVSLAERFRDYWFGLSRLPALHNG